VLANPLPPIPFPNNYIECSLSFTSYEPAILAEIQKRVTEASDQLTLWKRMKESGYITVVKGTAGSWGVNAKQGSIHVSGCDVHHLDAVELLLAYETEMAADDRHGPDRVVAMAITTVTKLTGSATHDACPGYRRDGEPSTRTIFTEASLELSGSISVSATNDNVRRNFTPCPRMWFFSVGVFRGS
jgi:hypothetical protein